MVVKSVEIDMSVRGDADSKAKLDDISKRAEALKKAFPAYALKIDSAAASEKLKVFRAQLADATKDRTENIKVKVDDSALAKLQKTADSAKGKGGPAWLGPALALTPAIGTLGVVAAGTGVALTGAFAAGAGALAGFGAVAKPVLSDALKAEQAVSTAQDTYNATIAAGVPKAQAQLSLQKANASARLSYNAALAGGAKPATALAAYHLALARNQLAYNSATNAGAFSAKAYAAEQRAIAKAYAGLSPQQIALSRQLGVMAKAWDDLKAKETPVIAGALRPWLAGISTGLGNLKSVITPMGPVVRDLGVQFGVLMGSSAFQGFMRWAGTTGAAVDKSAGNAVLDLLDGIIVLLPQFTPLITGAAAGLTGWADGFARWANSQKAADQIKSFLQWFHDNGPAAGGFLTNVGGALKALAPGLTAGGGLELKVLSDFFGWVAKLPPGIAGPLSATAGALLLLNKIGVFSVGVKFIGLTAGWVKKLLGGAEVDLGAAGMQKAGDTMVTAAGLMQRAADTMAGGAAAGGAAGGAGAATRGAAGVVAGASLTTVVGIAALAGAVIGEAISKITTGRFESLDQWKTKWAANLKAAEGSAQEAWHNITHWFDAGRADIATAFRDAAGGVLRFGVIMVQGARTITGAFLDLVQNIVDGAARAFGWVPGLGARLRGAAAEFTAWRASVNSDFDSAIRKMQGWQNELDAGKGTAASATRSIGASFTGAGVLMDTATGKVNALNQALTRIPRNTTANVDVNATGTGGFTVTGSGWAAGQGGIRLHAAGGAYIRAGSGPAADDVPVMASRGELVVPAGLVKAGAVDHLRGRIPGFAGGGLIGNLAGLPPFASGQEGAGAGRAVRAFLTLTAAAVKAEIQAKANAARSALGFALLPGGGAAAGTSAAAAQAWARGQLAAGVYGWGSGQFPPLLSLWNQESGWRWNALNPGSGAYGIPQSLPADKMASAGADWRTNPVTQMRWGLAYIRSVYGSPSGAWAHEVANNWYAKGGLIPGYASGGVAGQGAAYLRAWEGKRHPLTVNADIDWWNKALSRDATLAGAHGLSPAQHAYYVKRTAAERKHLAGLARERTVLRDWRGELGASDTALASWIHAAGGTPSLAKAVRGWKHQRTAQLGEIAEISKMLGWSAAQKAAIAKAAAAVKAHPVTPPLPDTTTHTYGGDVTDAIGAFLASVAAPFGAARGALVADRGATLRPGWNPPMFNNTGRPEQLVPARGGSGSGTLQIEWTGGNGGDELLKWIKKNVRIRGGTGPGAVDRAFGSR